MSRKRSVPSSSILKSKRAKHLQDCRSAAQQTMQKSEQRKRCKLCTKNKLGNKTNNICIECNVHLCYVNDRDCFTMYHC